MTEQTILASLTNAELRVVIVGPECEIPRRAAYLELKRRLTERAAQKGQP